MRSAMRRRRPSGAGARSIQTSSEEPPPMSNRRTPAGVRDRPARRSRRRPGAPRSRARRFPATGRSRLRTRVDELGAVLGRAAGFGGDQAGAADVAVGELGAADAERLDGARHGGVAEAAVGADPLAQADDARKGVDDAEAVVARGRDQQPAIVGAEVEGGIERPVGALPPRCGDDDRPAPPPAAQPGLPIDRARRWPRR